VACSFYGVVAMFLIAALELLLFEPL
jgi:hypothetical protein